MHLKQGLVFVDLQSFFDRLRAIFPASEYLPVRRRPAPFVEIPPEGNAIPYGKKYIQSNGYKPQYQQSPFYAVGQWFKLE
jgi:hypothetical protein